MHYFADRSAEADAPASRWTYQYLRDALASLWQLLLLGAVLLSLIWGTVVWEAGRIRTEHLANFGQDLMRLT